MKRAALLPALLLVCAPAGARPAKGPAFPDKNLAAAVQSALRLPKPEFKDEDLAKLNILEADGKGIKDLTGLEKCKNLLQVKLARNQVSDLKPIKDLPILQSLHLDSNQVSDLTPLAGLVKLQYLKLSNNKVSGDWAGFAQSAIEQDNPGCVAVASVGCGADSNPSPRGVILTALPCPSMRKVPSPAATNLPSTMPIRSSSSAVAKLGTPARSERRIIAEPSVQPIPTGPLPSAPE